MIIKNITILLLLLLLSQLNALAQIDILLKLESTKGRDIRYTNLEFELYKEDSLIFSGTFVSEFKNVNPGTYTILFLNIFQIKESITFNTDTLTNDTITIYIDRVDYNTIKIKSYIDLIRDHKSLKIHKQSIGCFHFTNDEIVIKKEGAYFVLYYDVYKKKLSENDMEFIRDFEKELQILPQSSCTTHNSYTISIGRKKIKINDETCEWYGLYYLKKNLNLKSYDIPNTGGFW